MATATVDFAAIDDGSQVDQGQTIDDGSQVDQAQDVQQTQDQVDGRRGPANVREAVRLASEAIPEQAAALKTLAASHFRAEAYAKVFPKVEEAQAAKQLIDGVGGLDGITTIQSRIQQYDTQDAGLKSGDPAVLDAAFKDFPEGMATLAPHYLDKLAKSSPEAFEATIAPHAMGMLDRAGIPSYIAAMMAETDPVRLKNMVGQLDQWIKKNADTVKTMRQAPQANAQDDKLKERMSAQEQREEQFFSKQVDSAVNSASATDLSKVVDQYAKTYKLNDVQKARFGTSLATRVVQEMLADDTFKKQDGIRRTSKDVDKVASFRAAEFARRLADAAFKEAQELYGATQRPAAGTGEVKPGGAKTAPGGGPLLVSRAMETSDLDMSKDPNGYLFIANKGYRKDGTFVQWK